MIAPGRIRTRIVRGIGANIFTHAVITFVQLGTVPVLASCWGLELFGWWIIVSTIPSYTALGDLGFATAAGIDMTMKVAQGNREGAVRTYQHAWVIVLALSFILLSLALSMTWLLPDRWFGGMLIDQFLARTIVTLLILQSLVALQGSILLAGFRCCSLYSLGAMTQAWIMLSEGLSTIFIASLGGSPLNTAAALVICRATGVAIQYRLLIRKAPWLKLTGGTISLAEIRQLTGPSIAIVALSAAQAVFLQGTTLVIGSAISAGSVAVFSAVRTLTRVGVQATALLNRAIAPEYSSVAARGDRKAQSRIIGMTVLSSILILLPAAFLLLAFGPIIIDIWSRGIIKPSFALVAVMTIVTVLHGFWNPLSSYLVAINRHSSFSYIYLGLSMVCVVAAYPLAISFGEVGAATALVGLDATMLLIVFTLTCRQLCTPADFLQAIKDDALLLMRKINTYRTS